MRQNDIDKLLRQALEREKDRELSQIPDKEDIGHVFSPEFDKKAKESFNRHANKIDRINTFGRRAAVFFVTIAVALVVMMTARSNVKQNPDFSYVIKWHQIDVRDNHKYSNGVIEQVYELSDVPVGYSLTFCGEYPSTIIYRYENDGKEFSIEQKLPGVIEFSIPEAETEIENREINGIEVLSFISEKINLNYYFWYEDGYPFYISAPYDIGDEIASKVIGNMVEKTSSSTAQ